MTETADILIRDAKVYTVDEAQPWADAVAVRGDRIAWAGSEEDADEHRGPGTEVIGAGGRSVLPGIVDSHNHVRLGSNEHAVQLAGAESLEEVHRRIAAWLAEHPDAEWVEAEGFNYGALPGGRMPTAEDLEGPTGGRPAFVLTYDVHNAWLNREALARFGIDGATDRVAFGIVHKDPEGTPTGMIGDVAVMALERRGHAALEAVLPSFSPDRQYQRLLASLEMAIRSGITTVVEPQNSLDDIARFDRARAEGELRSRLIAALFHPPDTTADELDAFAEAATRWNDDRLRVGPLKLYIDDVIEPHTAAMLEPYATDPRTTGDTFYDPGDFLELIARLDARGFQTFTHAIGDRGVRVALDAHRHARERNGPRDARHQLVHVECPHPDDIPRFAELGVVACMQPRHFAPDLAGAWRAAVGPDRERRAAPFRELLEAGAALAFSSDWNVAEMDPLIGIYSAITRADLAGDGAWATHQTVDLTTAIRAYTMGGAYANFCEADRGSITPGKYADLIVLSDDLFALEPRQILDARVELTMVGGTIEHRTI